MTQILQLQTLFATADLDFEILEELLLGQHEGDPKSIGSNLPAVESWA
jgi:hypothetical protein